MQSGFVHLNCLSVFLARVFHQEKTVQLFRKVSGKSKRRLMSPGHPLQRVEHCAYQCRQTLIIQQALTKRVFPSNEHIACGILDLPVVAQVQEGTLCARNY